MNIAETRMVALTVRHGPTAADRLAARANSPVVYPCHLAIATRNHRDLTQQYSNKLMQLLAGVVHIFQLVHTTSQI